MKDYISTFKKEKIAYKVITVIIIAFTLFFLFRVVKNTIVGLDYPNEILETANVSLTESLLNGNVPYDRANIVTPGEEPPINFEYPFLHSIFAAAISVITGGNTIAAHYLISLLAMVLSAGLSAAIIFRYSRTTVAPTLGFLLIMFCHWRYGYITASPDGFGLFITILTLYYATRPVLKRREIWCAVGTVAAFYSKQYFAGICFSIFIFMWCYSRKEALKYFMWCVILLALSMTIITIKWPVFWVYSVLLLMHGCFQGWGADGFIYVLEQMKYLAFVFVGMIAIIAVASVKYVKSRKSESLVASRDNGSEVADVTTSKNFKEKSRKQLITEGNALPLFLIQIPVQIVMLFIFGRNDGAYLTYFLQLLIPSIAIAALILMEKMEIGKNEWIFMGVYGFVALFTIYFGWGKLPMHMLTQDEVNTWQQAYALMDEYRDDGPILHCNATAYYAIKRGDSMFGSGHSGDINDKNYEEWKENAIQQALFPDAGAVFEENLTYRQVMQQRIRDKELGMVAVLEGGSSFVSYELLEESGYTMVASLPLQLGNMTYQTVFWAVE